MSEQIGCDVIERRDDLPAAGAQHDPGVGGKAFRATHWTVLVHEHDSFELRVDAKPASFEPVRVA